MLKLAKQNINILSDHSTISPLSSTFQGHLESQGHHHQGDMMEGEQNPLQRFWLPHYSLSCHL